MNTNQNSTAYYGSITVVTGEDDADIHLYENTLQPSGYTDPFSSRKLACIMLSHYLANIDPPESLMLGVNVVCIDVETEATYPILSLMGDYDTVNWMLENEIEILEGNEQPITESKKSTAKKEPKVKNDKKTTIRPVRAQVIGFDYPNRN